MLQRLAQVARRLQSYPRNEPVELLLELALLWIIVYAIFRFLHGTRAARALKGLALLLVLFTIIVKVLAGDGTFDRLKTLYSNFLTFGSLALVIVFQPELRRALVQLGEARLFRGGSLRKAQVIEELLGAVAYLSRNKIGALIAIERDVGLRGIIEAGTRLDAVVSKDLLNTIFWPGSALHDMGVVIQGDRITAAGVQFPLADSEQFAENTELGSRHRAAVGLSQEADALVIVVSEETGTISLAERGELTRPLTVDMLRSQLVRGLGRTDVAPTDAQGVTV